MRVSKTSLGGILIPFTTPFDEDESFNPQALGANIRRWNETGVAGYVALGSTGERVHLSEREYAQVIETARADVPSDLAFIVGAGQQSTRATIDEVAVAARAGADAVLVITPGFYRSAMTQEALFKHYMMVADAAPVPLVLYNIPQNTCIRLTPETIARLGAHENICGVKDSSGDFLSLDETLRLVPTGFAVLTGNGALLAAALAAGATGAILAVACVAPQLSVAIFRAIRLGQHERAFELQRRLTPLTRAVTTRYGLGGLKAALELSGYAGGRVRAPLEPAGSEARREIARLLAEAAPDAGEEALLDGEVTVG